METWPATLPKITAARRLSAEGQETIQRYEMSWGTPIQRRKFSNYCERFALDMLMTSNQLQILYTFYDNALSNGASEFSWEHPIRRTTETVRFYQRFTYNYFDSGYFEVTLYLEILP